MCQIVPLPHDLKWIRHDGMPETRPVGSRHFNISLKKKNIDIPVEANFSEKFQKWLIGDRINTEAIEIEDF